MNSPLILWLIIVLALASPLACQKSESANRQLSSNQNESRPEANPELNLLRRYGWTAEGAATESMLELPNPVTAYLSTRRYLEASKVIGLDFSGHAGQKLPMRTYKVTNEAVRGYDLRAHLLIAGQDIVGAWLSVVGDEAPGVYPLSARPHQRRQ
ncbi:MAG: hypothetical protein AUG51_05775 [Acidobacteria bacterium 13_1_20CM_3_53_8]|nr:MAG: hypothetical protein AUG51_05775 [Acidobacteria bacterium 13_1_20CM_3_53_8]